VWRGCTNLILLVTTHDGVRRMLQRRSTTPPTRTGSLGQPQLAHTQPRTHCKVPSAVVPSVGIELVLNHHMHSSHCFIIPTHRCRTRRRFASHTGGQTSLHSCQRTCTALRCDALPTTAQNVLASPRMECSARKDRESLKICKFIVCNIFEREKEL
jgi:hypothetical protein